MSYISLFHTNTKLLRTKQHSLKNLKPAYTARISFAGSSNIAFDNSALSKKIAAIITGLELKKTELSSISPSLGAQLFLYVGGESYYTIRVSGMAFANTCDLFGTGGVSAFLNYYDENNVKQTGKFIKIAIGTRVYKGYLTSMTAGTDINNEGAFTFDLIFYGIPTR